jgi:hypothetical protein
MFERFLWNDAGTLEDQTIEWSDPYAETAAWDAKSYLYVSSFLPFNHKYFDIATANDQSGTLSVEVYVNNSWVSVVDIVDYTADLTKSGNIYFTTDIDYGWDLEGESSDITELSTTNIYNTYWMRFGFGAAAASALVINYIGQKFCNDHALFSEYPILNNTALMNQFKTGQTDWIPQEVNASTFIVRDLTSRKMILSKDQVLDTKRYELACVHKTAEIIFGGLGTAYIEDKKTAKKEYGISMNQGQYSVDLNQNARLDRSEKIISHRMTR